MKAFLALLCTLTCGMLCHSQSYIESSQASGITYSYSGGTYGTGVSFVDFDQDGWDDITINQSVTGSKIYKNYNGTFQAVSLFAETLGNVKSTSWVDFDNDGDLDFFVTRREGVYSLYLNTDGIYTDIFFSSGIPVLNALTYGHSWGDYDKDGFLDLYIANYDSNGTTNYLIRNNGNGTFEDVTEEAGVGNGSVYSFQGLWIDYDEDGWQDLYVVNDRNIATNNMYRNLGDGTFEDVTDELGLSDFFFSMCNVGSDYDNDGDVDLLVTNNPFGHRLYNNDGGQFSNVAEAAGVATYDHCWGSAWIDYDNNGWQDLYIACSPFWNEPGKDRFYVSNEDGTSFTENDVIGISEIGSISHAVAAGDFNNDGMFDLFVVNDSPDYSMLFESAPGDNNYLKFTLEGVVSNRDGVGAKVSCWANDLEQTRYTFCGESYLSQNSRSEIFGLGQAENVDSLKITWPSGIIDLYTDVQANSSYNFIEGYAADPFITVDGDTQICEGDSVLVSGNFSIENIIWSDGFTGPTRWISEGGEYSYSGTTWSGDSVQSELIETTIWETPELIIEISEPLCSGDANGTALIYSSNSVPIDSINWADGTNDFHLQEIQSGIYNFMVFYAESCVSSGQAILIDPDPLELVIEPHDITCFGLENGYATWEGLGGTNPYELSIDTLNNLSAGEYEALLTDSNGCQTFGNFAINSPLEILANLSTEDATCFNGTDGLAIANAQGGMGPLTLDFGDFDENSLGAGSYNLNITDSLDCSVDFPFVINQPDDLEYTINTTASTGSSDGIASIVLSGATPPYEIEWGDGSNNDYYDGLTFGSHMVIITDAEGCNWELEFFIDVVGIDEPDTPALLIYPNPFSTSISIESKIKLESVVIIDQRGELVESIRSELINSTQIIFPRHLSTGLYTLICVDKNGNTFVERLSRVPN